MHVALLFVYFAFFFIIFIAPSLSPARVRVFSFHTVFSECYSLPFLRFPLSAVVCY